MATRRPNQKPQTSAQTRPVPEKPQVQVSGPEDVQDAPDADLTPDDAADGTTDPEEEAKDTGSSRPRPVGAPEGRLVWPGEDVMFDAVPSEEQPGFVVVTEDVFKVVVPTNSNRYSYISVYRAGQLVHQSAVQRVTNILNPL